MQIRYILSILTIFSLITSPLITDEALLPRFTEKEITEPYIEEETPYDIDEGPSVTTPYYATDPIQEFPPPPPERTSFSSGKIATIVIALMATITAGLVASGARTGRDAH